MCKDVTAKCECMCRMYEEGELIVLGNQLHGMPVDGFVRVAMVYIIETPPVIGDLVMNY